MKRLCTICARGGSKGVKNKNIREVNGKPLIAHTILQAKKSELFEAIAVSTDSDDIASVAKEWGVDEIVTRPAALASDVAGKMPAIQHCVRAIETCRAETFDVVVDLDVTAPLRKIADIRDAVFLLESEGIANVITGTPARKSPYFNLVELNSSGVVQLSKPADESVLRRQDAPPCYDMNASIYVWNRDKLLEDEKLFREDTKIHVMDEVSAVDVDTELDFKIVKFLMETGVYYE